jgi:hypothetical protein
VACALQDQAGTWQNRSEAASQQQQPEALQAVGGKKKGTHFKNATANFKAEQAEYGVGEEGEKGEEALCESGSWEEWMGGRDEGTGGWDPAWGGQGRYKKRRGKGAQWFNN